MALHLGENVAQCLVILLVGSPEYKMLIVIIPCPSSFMHCCQLNHKSYTTGLNQTSKCFLDELLQK